MHAALSDDAFILKRHGRISGGKYRLYGLRHDEPLLFIEETTGEFPEPSVTRACEDEQQKREILCRTTSTMPACSQCTRPRVTVPMHG